MQTQIEISRSALAANFALFRRLAGRASVAAVVKSEAYGHGLDAVVSILESLDDRPDYYAVNSIAEAVRVADRSDRPILVMGRLDSLADYRSLSPLERRQMVQVVSRRDEIEELNRTAPEVAFHLKVDSGMSRLGYTAAANSEIWPLLDYLGERPELAWRGVMTHFANVEDVTHQQYALGQIERFERVLGRCRALAGERPLLRHAAASAATLLLPQAHYDMVRVGISLYGLWPSSETRLSALSSSGVVPELRPALRWTAQVAHLHQVAAGVPIGYGCTVQTFRESLVAVVPVGYNEGYDRSLSQRSHVLLAGQRAPLLGRVCMNMIMVDVTHIPGVAIGDEVVLLGDSGDEVISAEGLAALAGTINYEVVTRILHSLPRRVVD